MPPEFKEKIVAYVDILGFSQLVPKVERNEELSLEELLSALGCLERKEFVEKIRKLGPVICPESKCIHNDLDYQVTQVSDCVVISCEASPVGVLNLTHHCATLILELLKRGFLCRGYVTIGNLFHHNGRLVGSAYMRAYRKEAFVKAFSDNSGDIGTPFIEIDQAVVDCAMNFGDSCVKKMFKRYVICEAGFSAVYPFQLLVYMGGIGGDGGLEEEKKQNNYVRQEIKMFLDRAATFIDMNNEGALGKFKYYRKALNAQLAECDEADESINLRYSPFPRNMI